MCYYNGQKIAKTEFIRLRQTEKPVALYKFLNLLLLEGFSYGKSAVLKPIPGKEDFDIVQMEWGFIPPYMKTREDVDKMRRDYKDEAGRFRPPLTMLNAVSEEMLAKGKIYRDAALHRRCLVLSSGFYEWRHVNRINKRTGEPLKTADKFPYFISLKDRPYFFMAGIWQPWTDKVTGEYIETFAIVTTAANKLMEQVHNSKKRMPTILNEDLAYEWLFGDLDESRITEIGRTQFPWEKMEAYPIAKDFRNAGDPMERAEYDKEVLSPIEWKN